MTVIVRHSFANPYWWGWHRYLWAVGNKHPKAWLIGLGNQLLWLIWICVVGAWGLLPMNVALWIVYGRNHLKWQRDLPANNTR